MNQNQDPSHSGAQAQHLDFTSPAQPLHLKVSSSLEYQRKKALKVLEEIQKGR